MSSIEEQSEAMGARCGLRRLDWFYQDRVRAPSLCPSGEKRRAGETTRSLVRVPVLAELGRDVVYVGTAEALPVYEGMLESLAERAGVDVSRVRFTTKHGHDRRVRGTGAVAVFDHYQDDGR